MTHDELREKVARAMFARSPLYSGLQWEAVNQSTRDMWLGDADAAIAAVREALREPSIGTQLAVAGCTGLMAAERWRDALAASPLTDPRA